MPDSSSNHYLQEVIRLAEELIQIAYQGDAEREDVGCGVVFGSVRDKAYMVKRLAAEEIERHQARAPASRRGAAPVGADHKGSPRQEPSGE